MLSKLFRSSPLTEVSGRVERVGPYITSGDISGIAILLENYDRRHLLFRGYAEADESYNVALGLTEVGDDVTYLVDSDSTGETKSFVNRTLSQRLPKLT